MILDLELLTDVALTAHGATATTHETLTYIPGQALLGAVARELYAASGANAWRIFHSGDVRFGCGLPLSPANEPSWPIPLSLHRIKGGADTHEATNLARSGARAADTQYTAIRDGYVDVHNRVWTTQSTRTMRTAIDAQGKARESYLFAISALTRGARFRAQLTSDDPVLLEQIRACLDGKTIRVGRSRSAELGSVSVRVVPDEMPCAPTNTSYRGDATSVLFWCLSDLSLRDANTGAPTLEPSAAEVGLPAGWSYAPSRSYVRTRRYSPWNGARRRPDLERQVLMAGSVLRFEGPSALSQAEWTTVEARLARRVGEHRAEGLGWLVLEPELLSGPLVAGVIKGLAPDITVERAPDDPLVAWMTAHDARAKGAATAHKHVARLLKVLGDAGDKWHLPASQWGEVRNLARTSLPSQLLVRLKEFAGATQGARATTDRWSAKFRGKTLSAWFLDAVAGIEEPAPVPGLVVELLATHAVRQQRREQEAAR